MGENSNIFFVMSLFLVVFFVISVSVILFVNGWFGMRQDRINYCLAQGYDDVLDIKEGDIHIFNCYKEDKITHGIKISEWYKI